MSSLCSLVAGLHGARRVASAALAALLVSSLAACTAQGQLNAGGRAYEVSAAYIHERPAVAWYGGSLQHEAIFLRYASKAGRPQRRVLQLTDGNRDAYEPSLQDVGGDALVAWYEQESERGDAGSRKQTALLGRFDSQGRPRWQRQLSATDASGRNPVVRVRGDQIHVAWIEQREGSESMIRVASLDAAGHWLQAPRDALVTGNNTWNLNAAIDAGGVFHVVYDSAQGSSAQELHWMRVLGDRIEDRRVSTDDGSESGYPDIAVDGNRAALTWFDARDGNAEVYLRCLQLDDSGAPPQGLYLDDSAALRVTHTSGDSTGAYLGWYGGGVELAWIEASGEQRQLLLQRFDSECRPLGKGRELSDAQGVAGIPTIAVSQLGFAVAWDEQRRRDKTQASGENAVRSRSLVLLRTWRGRPAH